MELTGKQRARLRSMANTLPVVLYIGKEGVTDATVKEAYDALQARELIKCSLMDSAPCVAMLAACSSIFSTDQNASDNNAFNSRENASTIAPPCFANYTPKQLLSLSK